MADVISQSQVIQYVADAGPQKYLLFLGAGASKSSGAPLGSEMIQEFRQRKYQRSDVGDEFGKWCAAQPWYGKPNEYSVLFEDVYETEARRQRYVESKLKGCFPAWGYLYLSNMLQQEFFSVVFTTNFDDLISDALKIYLSQTALVCSADSQVDSVEVKDNRPRIIKLHGDYLFRKLKNTEAELEELDSNMGRKFKEFGAGLLGMGMVVIGYAGQDKSIMSVIESLMEDERSFPEGVYWGIRPDDKPSDRVSALSEAYPKRFQLFKCPDFDTFMARLHDCLGFGLPTSILNPHEALRDKFNRLVLAHQGASTPDPIIEAHCDKLKQQLDLPWAVEGDPASLELLQAQLELYRRDYRAALEHVEKFVAHNEPDSGALTVWGSALQLKAQEEGIESEMDEAVRKWEEARALDPNALTARRQLVAHYDEARDTKKAIIECEFLVERCPNDRFLRSGLVNLYMRGGRNRDALAQANELARRYPNDSTSHAIRAAVLEQAGMQYEAVQAVREGIRLEPNNAFLHEALARGLFALDFWDDAITEYERAIGLDPSGVSLRIQLARVLVMRQKGPFALKWLQEASDLEPGLPEVAYLQAQVHFALNQFDEAQRSAQTMLDASANDPRARLLMGQIMMRLNHTDLAKAHFEAAQQVNPTAPAPYMWLSVVYRMLGQPAEAESARQSLWRCGPEMGPQLDYMHANWPATLAMLQGQQQGYGAPQQTNPLQQLMSWLRQ